MTQRTQQSDPPGTPLPTAVPDETVPVLIAGAGPGGLSAAVFLGLHGVPALVVERHPSTSTAVKATGQYPHTMEALAIAGAAETVRERGRAYRSDFHMVVAKTLAGPVLRTLMSGDQLSMRHVSPEDWGTASQSAVEGVLADRAAELGARLRFSTRLMSITQDADGVTGIAEHTETGEQRVIRAKYLVAADGWRSGIRQSLGIAMRGRGTVGKVLRVLFEADLSEPLSHTDGAADGRRFTALHVGHAVLFNTEVPGLYGYFRNLTPELPDGWWTNRDTVAAQIGSDLGIPDTPLKIEEIGETEISCGVAERFRDGRVLLVGDAAHVMPPTGGMGGNTAYLDGLYLGWKLAAVLNGTAGEALLDSHEAERRPYAEELVEQQFANLVDRISPELADKSLAAPLPPPVMAFGYRYPKGAVLSEPHDDGELFEDPARPTGRPGSHAPYVPLTRADGSATSTTALFGHAFVLLTGPDGAAWTEGASASADALGVAVQVHRVGPGTELLDAEGAFADAYGIGSDGASLVRPDRFVAWRSAGAHPDPAAEIERVLRHVLHRPVH
ncbi:FAD-dependent monooxygenase [Streptomyces spinoverrucosus]|uniref:FAD-dependent monooxygenase n=1 Tax=Streptomyces spinoverrucosus TaxID=284043 RepID=UPI0018C3885F|nr:FAD-dependent monooxygenase [Streptomyces spinoverrucosus]MBG0851949.1 FAD-dependent monooxygenase [Streptomyces spinoverrucosus]